MRECLSEAKNVLQFNAEGSELSEFEERLLLLIVQWLPDDGSLASYNECYKVVQFGETDLCKKGSMKAWLVSYLHGFDTAVTSNLCSLVQVDG